MERASGLEIPVTLEEVCRPQRLALLVYDMQVGIVRHLPEPDAFVARVAEAVVAARNAGAFAEAVVTFNNGRSVRLGT